MKKVGIIGAGNIGMAIAKGLDGAIANPLNEKMMATIVTAETLAGRDEYCMAYLGAYRAGKIDFK